MVSLHMPGRPRKQTAGVNMTQSLHTTPASGDLSLSICACAAQPALSLTAMNELALVNRQRIGSFHDLLACDWNSVCHVVDAASLPQLGRISGFLISCLSSSGLYAFSVPCACKESWINTRSFLRCAWCCR